MDLFVPPAGMIFELNQCTLALVFFILDLYNTEIRKETHRDELISTDQSEWKKKK